MPSRATKLLKLRDFCVGGAVLMYRLDGARVRGSAERAIRRGAAARNMVDMVGQKGEKDRKYTKEKKSCSTVIKSGGRYRRDVECANCTRFLSQGQKYLEAKSRTLPKSYLADHVQIIETVYLPQ